MPEKKVSHTKRPVFVTHLRLGVEANDKTTDYSKFVFYGIRTMIFVGRTNNVTDGLSAREREVAVRATARWTGRSFEDR